VACPCIRYADGYYYVLYTEHRTPRWFFEVYAARSKDLKTWDLSGANPVLTPDASEDGIDASDLDLVEFSGKTHVYYAVGDQRTWMNIKRAVYDGPMAQFLASWFATPGVPTR
jgi:beta-xylosidase